MADESQTCESVIQAVIMDPVVQIPEAVPNDEVILVKEDVVVVDDLVTIEDAAVGDAVVTIQDAAVGDSVVTVQDAIVAAVGSQPITHDGKEMDPGIKSRLEKQLQKLGITNYVMQMAPGSDAGDNMTGIIAKVQINGKEKNGEDVEINWIVKIAPQSELFRRIANVQQIYKREVFMYEILFPTFRRLEDEKQVPKHFDSYPGYVFSYMKVLKESFVMQDMLSLGYVMRNKREPLDIEHVKVVMAAYGKFHALSYAVKHYKPDTFDTLTFQAKDIFASAVDLSETSKSQQASVDNAVATLDPVADAEKLKIFSIYAENFMDIFVDASTSTNQYSVIGHGDSWTTNMLFKYDDPTDTKSPVAVCFLDFQLGRYASPACDLSHFIFTCTDKAFRDENYDEMIKLYHNSLSAHLKDLGVDAEKYFPFEALQAELKRFSVVGLQWSLMALMAMNDANETPDIKYKERVRDIIIEFVERGYLDFVQ